MIIIGPSTGWMYERGINSISEQKKIITEIKANALEINISFPNKEREKSLDTGDIFDSNYYRGLHTEYNPDIELNEQVSLIKKIFDTHKLDILSIHPIKVPERYYEEILSNNIPIAIENMDKNKSNGYQIKELTKLLEIYPLTFVFDVQHAFEHDPSMVYAKELFDAIKEKLSHIHVSGETKEIDHALLTKANNKEVIIDFIRKIFLIKNTPIILEGQHSTTEELKQEIQLLTKELNQV